tara:strand:- start:1774 stop:1968 length:195 start_codon:yes stop_codon:yes gene_type:complete
MCQGFSGKSSNKSDQNSLQTYKDFANQAASAPANLGLSIKRQKHREKRLETIMNGGDDPGPPGF